MASSELFDGLVADFEKRELPDLTPRRCALPRVARKVDAVVGMRRSGKTWLLYQNIRELLEGGLPRSRILYVNFEDERLLPLETAHLTRLLEAFYRRHPEVRTEECWLFLDEIQNVPGWEMFVRRIVDSERVRVTVTGSSARLLGREIATSLRGRSLTTELLPFSFREAVEHHGVALPHRWPPASSLRSRLEERFRFYLRCGGFPEVQNLAIETRTRVLQEYVDVAVFRDVVERHGIGNVRVLRHLVRRFLGSPGGLFSVNRVYNELKSQGLAVSKDKLHEYVAHLEDAFLVLLVPICTRSEKARMVNPRKAYVVDHGLAVAASFASARDEGHLLENIVLVELRRRGCEICYVRTRSGFEVDFLATRHGAAPGLIQTCTDLSEPRTRKRELRALEEALSEHDRDEAWIVTLDESEDIELPTGTVHVVPAWSWLLRPV